MHVKQRADYTFKYNRKLGRHGWLRLTPAYSMKLVTEIVQSIPSDAVILDPFSGTATTTLVAAANGLTAYGHDINPFLVWLGNAKCRNYTPAELADLEAKIENALVEYKALTNKNNWIPEIHNIGRWWPSKTLKALSALRQALVNQLGEPTTNSATALAWVSFCSLIIETSAAAFNHVSVSFYDEVPAYENEQVERLYREITHTIMRSAKDKITGQAAIHLVDSREASPFLKQRFSHVITSPPYPNRISYIRELRPYMYWTKFLTTAQEAGELDWQAIGGTWGIATSRLKDWQEEIESPKSLKQIAARIVATEEKNALLMANYVWKYFHDMHQHLYNLRHNLHKGASVVYIVGNSSFYGVQVPTQELLANSLKSLGFTNIGSQVVRKRNSKKELFEYCLYATWQENEEVQPAFLNAHQPKITQLSLF